MEMKKESRHALLQHELTTELKSLRASVRETAEGFILCKEGEIETLLDYLLKMPPGRLKAISSLSLFMPHRSTTQAKVRGASLLAMRVTLPPPEPPVQ